MAVLATGLGWLGKRRERMFAWALYAVHWLILLAAIVATLTPAVVLDQHSRLFLLKIVLAGALTALPG